MFFRRFFFAILFGLLLLVGFAGMRHQAGYARGYEQGYAAAAQDLAAEPAEAAGQSAPAAPHRPGWSWGFFGLFGSLFKCLLMFAAIAFFMKLFFFGCRRRWKGHQSGPWSHHGHWGKWGHPHRRGHRPQKGDDDYEKQPEDVEPDVRSY